MSSKRQATTDLNHDNWDKEEEPEDPGHFVEASDEQLKSRVIKKARRMMNETDSKSSSETQSIFKGFAGFTHKSLAAPIVSKESPFAFLSKLPEPKANVSIASSAVTSTSNTFNTSITKSTLSLGSGTALNKFITETKAKGNDAYFSKIIKLNKSFRDWIVKQIEEEPLCNLKPTFKDYEKYIKEIEEEASKEPNNAMKTLSTMISPTHIVVTTATTSTTVSTTPFFNNFKFNPMAQSSRTTGIGSLATKTSDTQNSITSNEKLKEKQELAKANISGISFGIKPMEKTNGNMAPSINFSFNQTKTNGDAPTETSKAKTGTTASSLGVQLSGQPSSMGFSFGLKSDAKPFAPNTGFSFGLKKEDSSNSSGFSFICGSAPFTFANIKPPAAEPTKKDDNEADDDDEDDPPKLEIREIVEEDALFAKRCKVFVKKDNAFKDHGVGTLYLKPVKDSDKTQLLVRSSNNLGTILVNVILVDGMPSQRMGKNNVMLVHPGSSEDAKPQTTLLRVKDSNDADELLEIINKHKK